MIAVYNEASDKPYLLNIVMNKAETDVGKLLKNGPIENFLEFLPILRDCTLGVVYMNSHAIAHRDIKPGNIMKLKSNNYVLADYGEGENLSYERAFAKDCFYQIGTWRIRGSVPYLDPHLISHYRKLEEGESAELDPYDLFKADIYSLGLSFY